MGAFLFATTPGTWDNTGMINLFKKTDKPVKCVAQRSPKCEQKMTRFNRMKNGDPICEPCTNL